MKKTKKTLLMLCCSLGISLNAHSQDLGSLLMAGDDANLLLSNYLTPLVEVMSYSLNNGWYHTAKTHKKLGFDISLLANVALVPNSAKSFLFEEGDYQYLSVSGNNKNLNTVMGTANNSTINVQIPEAGDYKVGSFRMPGGIGDELPTSGIPTPMLQASVGIPFSTDISLRYLPGINTKGVTGNLMGIGIKHNLLQYMGPIDKLPLNLALFAGYTSMDVQYTVSETHRDQLLDFRVQTYTVQALVSLDLPLIAVYGGSGLDRGSAALQLKGAYVLAYSLEGVNLTETVTDPIDMRIKAHDLTTTLGARLNLPFFKIYGAYSMKQYNTLTAGVAFSVR